MPSPTERIGVSRESLVEAYIAALPFIAVAVVAIPGGGCRIETAAPGAPGEANRADGGCNVATCVYRKPYPS